MFTTEPQDHQHHWADDVPSSAARDTLWLTRPWYLPVKRGIELLMTVVLMALTAPLILVAAALVKLTSRGPAFYSQKRLGKHGRIFTVHKIRTMVHNCESVSGPQWATPGDPRITRLGRFLRRTHLDELPQLWNVLRGDMSLVGPRPERPEFTPTLEAAFPHYRARLLVRPGLTGLAQVQLPADTDLDSVRRKLTYDLFYIREIGPWLDMRILLGTILYLFRLPIHWLPWLHLVPSRKAVELAYQSAVGPAASTPPSRASRAVGPEGKDILRVVQPNPIPSFAETN